MNKNEENGDIFQVQDEKIKNQKKKIKIKKQGDNQKKDTYE